MFGLDHKDDDTKDAAPAVQPAPAQSVNNGLLGIDDDDQSTAVPTASAPAATPEPTTNNSDPLGAPTLPTPDDSNDSMTNNASPALTSEEATTTPSAAPAPSENNDELLDIKREALQELSPLIDHLDQSAEEKFRTTMMMIQASDNQALIPQAFSTAKQITDDKKRAQALLDVVNEINYFTQKETS